MNDRQKYIGLVARKRFVLATMGALCVVVLGGCTGQTDEEQSVTGSGQETTEQEVVQNDDTTMGEEEVEVRVGESDTQGDMATGHIVLPQDKDLEVSGDHEEGGEKKDDDSQDEADKCIADGKIYSAMMGECFENDASSSDGDKKLELDDDDSAVDRAAKECVNDGGLYNSQLEKCFK